MGIGHEGTTGRIRPLPRRTLLAALAAGALIGPLGGRAPAQARPRKIPGRRSPRRSSTTDRCGTAGVLAIDAPYRAEDAALVPLTIRSLLPPGDTRQFARITW